MVGKTVAHYEVIERIGAGGMGEVFRARDTRLGRDVALKMLPELFAKDPERLGRFQREAKLLASLNHSGIATIHGIEEADGHHFLIMELVAGDDLSVRLARGAMTVREALPVARALADALAIAHEQGVVHRDLKPANIKLGTDGGVKVLDFGLAKAIEGDPGDPNISQSPTITALGGTSAGVILGTAAYMSPEQARGKPVDRRTDVWAFGCVLYEMLTGQQVFPGETVSDTIAKILEREPDWSALPPDTPAGIHRLLRRCLEKEQKRRLGDIGDARVELEDVMSGTHTASAVHAVPSSGASRRRVPLVWIGLTVVSLIAAAIFATAYFRAASTPRQVIRANIPRPPDTRFVSMGDYAGPVVISPDGKRLAFVATNEQLERLLWIRDLDANESRPIAGTQDATFPFWSPDGKSVAYFTNTRLMRIEVSGGSPITICEAPNGRGGSWGEGGVILFSPDYRSSVYRVLATGGDPVAITAIDSSKHSTHRWPFFMPDGKHFVYVATHHDVSKRQHNAAYFGSIDGGDDKLLIRCDTGPLYASGHLLFLRDNTCLVAPFDPVSGEIKSEPAPLIDKVQYDLTTWHAALSVSETGILVYHSGEEGLLGTRLAMFDRGGNDLGNIDETWAYYSIQLSPDGDRLAVSITSEQGTSASSLDIWVYDVARGVRTRLTFDTGANLSPAWSPDGNRIAYGRLFPGDSNASHSVRTVRTDGGGGEVLHESNTEIWPSDWSDDGRYILCTKGSYVGGVGDVWVLPLDPSLEPFDVVATDFEETEPSLSPDGRWLSYTSNESGPYEVYVIPFNPPVASGGSPNNDRPFSKWQISTEGGTSSIWSGDGSEIFFVKDDGRLWSASVDGSGNTFEVGDVTVLFSSDPWNFGAIGYDVTRDGQMFVVNSFSKSGAPPITIVLNWPDALRK